ncbi:hypothetical protein EIP91_009049 [Steccherinum ochraceum]|uniref:Non-structural maintenance of chromosomes element 1 homolog n=1 Tax=Steccherinum ochraceum TaxID=92696 RepID=A0A4R0R242_9APHY|nr:hypothetical protein EIP91_009049 [Steccherinum ochraceum]
MVSADDVQRLFLQAIFSRRIVTQKLALKLWEKCIDAVNAADETLEINFEDSRDSWDKWVQKINEALNPIDLEFAHMSDQNSGKELYALVNRRGDEIAQMATEYSPNEIAYFKNLIEKIMLAPNESYCISSLAALREASQLKTTMTKSQAEVVLNSLVAKGWLHYSRGGKYTLSTRTLLELGTYLRSAYEDQILDCTVCYEMVTRGTACKTPNCKARLHKHCFTTYRRLNDTCPTCSTKWGNDPTKVGPVGESAFRDGQDKGKRRTRRSSEGSDEEDEEVPMDEDGEPSQSQSLSQSQPSQSQPSQSQPSQSQPSQSQPARSQRKGKRRAVREDSMDVDEEEQQDGDDDAEAEASPAPATQRRRSSRR